MTDRVDAAERSRGGLRHGAARAAVVLIAVAFVLAGCASEGPSGASAPDPDTWSLPTSTTPTAAPSAAGTAIAAPSTVGRECTARVAGGDVSVVRAAQTAAGSGTVCFGPGRYVGDLTADVDGQTWALESGAVLTGAVRVTAPRVTIRGGAIERPTGDAWATTVTVAADDVTIEGIEFRGGGLVMSILGRDRTRIVGNTFAGQAGSAIAIWGESNGADGTLIEGNTIVQTATKRTSPIIGRGSETDPSAWNRRTIVKNNRIDQGDGDLGWFGVELARSPESRIEGNEIRGGRCLISLPRSDRSRVRSNRFELAGPTYWGVEIAGSDDVVVEQNVILGDGSGTRIAVSMNTDSQRAVIRFNRAARLTTFVELSGDRHLIVDNELVDVLHVTRYDGGPNSRIERNG